MRNSKWTVWALLIWFVAGFLLAFFDRPLVDAIWIVAGIVFLAWLGVGVIFAISSIISTYMSKNYYGAASAFGFVCLGFLMTYQSPYIESMGNDLVVQSRFKQHFSEYERIVSEAKNGVLAEGYGESNGVRYQVESGPPLRVAFPQPGGILDNWEGIIYDPTGEVLKAKGWAEPGTKLSAPPEVVELFGGSLVSCTRLAGDYYRCWFT